MVGFKSIGLLFILLFLASCIPQTKLTECETNEAFNATLRTCVPVMNGPSSFIDIDSFIPSSVLSKYKNDSTAIQFSIVVSNPFAQTYTVAWERVYNGTPYTNLTGTSSGTTYTYTTNGVSLATQVGTHIITAKILDSTNQVVDSHNFELKINDMPRPIIQTASVSPALYYSAYNPTQLPQDFSFIVSNNSAVMSGAGYKTEWKLYRTGVLVDSKTDNFPTVSPLPIGTLAPTGFNYPVYTFDPATIPSLGGSALGAYTLIGRVKNNAGEVVGEQQWTMNVDHPDLPKILTRDIYLTSSSPYFTTPSTAYHNIAYSDYTTFENFSPNGGATQGDYCVQVADPEGTYPLDSKFVLVKYYIDGATLVYTGTTAIGDDTVCLSEAPAATKAAVKFTNSSASSTQSHTLVARVFDEFSGEQYTITDMDPAVALGGYPISWDFAVKPQNDVPVVDFGTDSITCDPASGTNKSNCTVASDTNFTVAINLLSDDFYTLPGDESKFNYSIRLYENGVNTQSCTKTDPGFSGSFDLAGSDYQCEFHIKSYSATGPIDLSTMTYQIQAEISDTGSPIAGTSPVVAKKSTTLTWDFTPVTGVTETNNPPVIASGSWNILSPLTEGVAPTPGLPTFSATISDPENDDFNWEIIQCSDAACTTPLTLTSGTVNRTVVGPPVSASDPYQLDIYHTFPEDYLLTSGLGCEATLRNDPCTVYYKLKVTDIPDDLTVVAGVVQSSADPATVININPTPTLNTAFSYPTPSTFSAAPTYAFVGHPMSIANNPSAVLTDTSAVSAEKSFRYKWFIHNNTSVPFPTWTEIEGANTHNLVWTPSFMKDVATPTDNPVSFMLCVEDQPVTAVPTSSIGTANSTCNELNPWIVTVVNNLAMIKDLSTTPSSTELATNSSDVGKEVAVWYETPSSFNSVTSSAAYVAMIGNDKRIHIKKSLVKNGDQIDTTATEIISFNAFPSVTAHTVKDISITGTSNSSELYVAYLASKITTPNSFYAQVRRIDLKTTSGKLSPNEHAGKFGFDYNGLGVDSSNCSPVADCPTTATSGVTTLTFSPSGGAIGGSFDLETPNGDFTINFGTYNGTDTICDTCTGDQMATNVKNIINASTDPLLAGYSATSSGSTVTVFGARSSDYFDASVSNARVVDRLGKIYISGGNWYLPFINSSLGSSYNDKLSVYNGPTGAVMNSFTLLEPASNAGLASMDAAIAFDNFYDGTNLWIAMVSKTGSLGRLYKVNPTSFALTGSSNLFATNSEALLDVQVGASSSNVFIAAKASIGSELKLGVYNIGGTKIDEFEIDDSAHVDSTLTSNVFNKSSISSYKILPYGTEARLFAVSTGTPASSSKLYVARLRDISLSALTPAWTLSCGDCNPISELAQNVSAHVGLGVAPIRVKPNVVDPLFDNYRLASDGNTPRQGVKDIAMVVYGRLDSASATSCDPALGVFNVEGESIGSTTIYDGTTATPAAPADAGLYRSPFIKN